MLDQNMAATDFRTDGTSLEMLAKDHFDRDLTVAEKNLLAKAPAGEVAFSGIPGDRTHPGNDPGKADIPEGMPWWGPDRDIAADLIRWLCVDRLAREQIDQKGLQIMGAKITGKLDLNFTVLIFPLHLLNCALVEDASLIQMEAPRLTLDGSRTKSITADGAVVKGGIYLRSGFHAEGLVQLLDVRVAGILDCSDGMFNNPGGHALLALGADVKGSVHMRGSFHAKGTVGLTSARIGGELDCLGGRFENLGGVALDVAGCEVKGPVFLSDGFHADGTVRLEGLRSGGDLICSDGMFNNPSGQAFLALGADVKGSVYMRGGFHSKGMVDLSSAQIGGKLACVGGKFENPGGMALEIAGSEVKHDVSLGDGFHADGTVRLSALRCGGDLDCSGSTFNSPGQNALILEGVSVMGDIMLGEGFHANGSVQLPASTIGGNLQCERGHFRGAGGVAIDADHCDVKGSVFFSEGFYADGEVGLLIASVGGNLDCGGGIFHNPGGDALIADGSVVKGAVFLNSGAKVEGVVRFPYAQISGNLECEGSSLDNRGGVALSGTHAIIRQNVYLNEGFTALGAISLAGAEISGDLLLSKADLRDAELELSSASVNSIHDDKSSWPKTGKLHLDGFQYKRFAQESPRDANARLAWLALQPTAPFSAQPYLHLAEVLKAYGDDDGAANVLVAMEDRRRQTAVTRGWVGPAVESSEAVVLKATIGYGYRPLLAFWEILGLAGLGWILYRRSYLAGGMVPTEKEAYEEFKRVMKPPAHYIKFSPLIYSLENSLPLVKLGQADKWQPDSQSGASSGAEGEFKPAHKWYSRLAQWCSHLVHLTPSTRFLRWFLWVQILLGWLLATFFLAGITGIIRQK
jgi:hypothetical protein